MQLVINPLKKPLGAEVHGWQPCEELDGESLDVIMRALRQHLVLVFRGQPTPSDEELIRFASAFGDELSKGTEYFGHLVKHAEILPVSNIEDETGQPIGSGSAGALNWHTDYSFQPKIGKESFLEAVELPKSGGGSTYFCDMYVAFETLAPAKREQLRVLIAHHDILNYQADPDKAADVAKYKDVPQADHPMVITHPDSGRAALYVGPFLSRYVVGLPEVESQELLEELCEHALCPECIYKHDWRTGDLVVFDTVGTMHRRDPFDPKERRYMRQLSTVFCPAEAA